MGDKNTLSKRASGKPATTLPGTVQKIVKPIVSDEPEKAEIAVEGADHLYREIRIPNSLTDPEGKKVALKPGAEVDVTVAADPRDTVPVEPKSMIEKTK